MRVADKDDLAPSEVVFLVLLLFQVAQVVIVLHNPVMLLLGTILVSQAALRQVHRISSCKILHKLLRVVLLKCQWLLLYPILFTDHIIVATSLQLLVYVHVALLEHVMVLIDLVLHHLLMHLLR